MGDESFEVNESRGREVRCGGEGDRSCDEKRRGNECGENNGRNNFDGRRDRDRGYSCESKINRKGGGDEGSDTGSVRHDIQRRENFL
jgi:hypothetical protein